MSDEKIIEKHIDLSASYLSSQEKRYLDEHGKATQESFQS